MSDAASLVIVQHPPHGTAPALHLHTPVAGATLPTLLRGVLATRSADNDERELAAALLAELLRTRARPSVSAYPVPVDYPWLVVDAQARTVARQSPDADRPGQIFSFDDYQGVEDWAQLGFDAADQLDD